MPVPAGQLSYRRILERGTMRRFLRAGVLLSATLCLAACGELLGNHVSGCNVGPGPAFNVITRDQNGTGQALGALVVFHDDSTSHADSAYRTDDTLSDYGGVQNRRYDIKVSKRYYADGWAIDAITHSDNCGLGQTRLTISIALLPGAPAIRSMTMLPSAFYLDPGEDDSTLTFRPFIDANLGISHAVRWTITGDSTAATFDPVTATLTYHCQPLTTHMVFKATLLADTTFSDSSRITVVGHPTETADARCR
jgi:hypothetical protein